MRINLWHALAVALALIGGSSCASESPVAVGPPVLCTGPTVLKATGGAVPVFTWSPNCLASELLVVGPPSENNIAKWWIRAPGVGFPSGVTYGQVPTGATPVGPPASGPFAAGTYVSLQDAKGDRIGYALIPAP
jgi:hypothetical protein